MSSLPTASERVPDVVPPASAAEAPGLDRPGPAGIAAVTAARRSRVPRGIGRVLRSAVTIGMFGAALAAGMYVYLNQTPTLTLGDYPPVATVPEPAPAHEIVELILADDAPELARKLDADSLEALSGALQTIAGNPQPLVEVTDIKYLGAVSLNDATVVSYLARGRDAMGQKWVVGFALRVQGDSVVGVN